MHRPCQLPHAGTQPRLLQLHFGGDAWCSRPIPGRDCRRQDIRPKGRNGGGGRFGRRSHPARRASRWAPPRSSVSAAAAPGVRLAVGVLHPDLPVAALHHELPAAHSFVPSPHLAVLNDWATGAGCVPNGASGRCGFPSATRLAGSALRAAEEVDKESRGQPLTTRTARLRSSARNK
jgi:hypothetical protein